MPLWITDMDFEIAKSIQEALKLGKPLSKDEQRKINGGTCEGYFCSCSHDGDCSPGLSCVNFGFGSYCISPSFP